MTTKSDPQVDTLDVELDTAADAVELRDESDEIIDNLKRQLASLQGQLDQVRASASGGSAATPPAQPELALATWNAELAPRLTSRLQAPAAELTARLERIIEQVQDPDLRAELEQCRETAFYLFDTFRRISENHQLLTDSLSDAINDVAAADFARLLEHLRGDQATPLAVTRSAQVPQRLALRSQSALTILRTLAKLAESVTDGTMRVELNFARAPAETSARPAGPGEGLCVRLVTAGAWERLQDAHDVSSVAFRPGATAQAVVDLLYVEKIVELQGGTLDFYQQGGKVFGFEVWLPALPVEIGGGPASDSLT